MTATLQVFIFAFKSPREFFLCTKTSGNIKCCLLYPPWTFQRFPSTRTSEHLLEHNPAFSAGQCVILFINPLGYIYKTVMKETLLTVDG